MAAVSTESLGWSRGGERMLAMLRGQECPRHYVARNGDTARKSACAKSAFMEGNDE